MTKLLACTLAGRDLGVGVGVGRGLLRIGGGLLLGSDDQLTERPGGRGVRRRLSQAQQQVQQQAKQAQQTDVCDG